MKYLLVVIFIIPFTSLLSKAECIEISGDIGNKSNTACIINEYNGHNISTGETITQTSNTKIGGKSNIFSCLDNSYANCEKQSKSLLEKNEDYSNSVEFTNGVTDNAFYSNFRYYD